MADGNQKGGVGKTSSAINMGFELSSRGFNTALVYVDPQASLSKNLIGEDELAKIKGIEECFLSDKVQLAECIVATKHKNLSVLPCHNELASVSAKILLDSPSFFAPREIIEKTKKNLNKSLDILGVVVMMIDRRAALYCQIEEQIRGFFGSKVFDSVISRTVKSEEAVTEGVGVGSLAPDSKIAGEYRALVNEILVRLGLVPEPAASKG
jgi:chromosome partitioning protein